jgi:CRP-like cAMP-binding protein
MKKINFITLSEKAIKSIKKITASKRYSVDAPLHYQGQTPIVAYLIVKGSILLLKKDKIYHTLTRGCLIGYRELFSNAPSVFTANILHNTEICFIDKSTLIEIKHSKSPALQELYSELTYAKLQKG